MATKSQALFDAISDGNMTQVKLLLDVDGSQVNQHDMDQDGLTPLHLAAIKGNIDMVKMLVEQYSANYDLEDMFGEVPVHKAADSGHIAIVSYLFSKKCKYADDVRHLVEQPTGDAPTIEITDHGDKPTFDQSEANVEAHGEDGEERPKLIKSSVLTSNK